MKIFEFFFICFEIFDREIMGTNTRYLYKYIISRVDQKKTKTIVQVEIPGCSMIIFNLLDILIDLSLFSENQSFEKFFYPFKFQ